MTSAGDLAVRSSITGLVGRGRQVDALVSQLRDTRLITLVGPAGVGKTRLAVESATRFSEQADVTSRFVSLGPVADEEMVASAIASALRIGASGGRASEAAVRDALQDRDLVLVLDNCEHLVGEVSRIADLLVPASPRLRMLTTSREPLRVAGEVLHEVTPLPVPTADAQEEEIAASEAVELFVARAREQDPEFDLAADPRAVGELCRRLDGLPLAIELAAGLVRALTPAQIVDRLDDRFRLLARGSRTAEPRHQTLRSAIEWSHALLEDQERTMLRRLSVFAHGFDLEAVETVCTEGLVPSDAAALIAALVDRSLVTRVSVDPARYVLLDTIRQYAAEQLAAAGETAATRDAHARHFAEVAMQAGRGLAAGEDKVWLAVFDWEHDNFRVALGRLIHGPDPVTGAQMAAALGEFWWVHAHGHNREGIRWLDAALARLPQDAPAELRVALCYHLGVLWAHDAGDWRRAAAILDRGLGLADAVPDRHSGVVGYAQTMRAKAAGVLGDTESALGLLAEAAARLPADADPWGASFVAWTRGSVLDRSDPVTATEAFEAALRVQQDRGLRGAIYLICAATVARRAEDGRDLDRARRLYEDVLTAWRELGTERLGQAHAAGALLGLARIALDRGDRQGAGDALAEAGPLVAQMGDRQLRTEVGALHDRLGRPSEEPTCAVLERQGEVWRVEFRSEVTHLADRKGLRQLCELVRRPDVELSALELAVAADGAARELGDAGPLLDAEAKRAYKQRLRELDGAVADAEADGDPHRAERTLGEREALLAELARATGLAGRDRRAGSALERARVNVTRTLRDAIAAIGEECPALSDHLHRHVHTGTLCRYSPDEPLEWRT